jgi:regulator of ribonuclease activity A
MNFQTADLYDLHAERLQVALPLFFSYGSKLKFSGEIVTIKCHEDNSLVAEQVSTPGQGKVLVIDGGGSLRCALVGDNLAQKAIENGWEGIVVFGCIRDSVIINGMDIGIKALQTNPAKSVKRNTGVLNETVRFADVGFTPGAYLYSDEDGIVVSDIRL